MTTRKSSRARLALEILEERQFLTVNISGNGNTDAASLISAGGPGDNGTPGFLNVGQSSTHNGSVTYLGNGWCITAQHVAIDNNVGKIIFSTGQFDVDMSTIKQLRNPNNSVADLKVFRLTTDPGLPEILPSLISSSVPSGRQIMIGNGLSLGTERYWHVNTSQPAWIWTNQSPPADANPPGDKAGFNITSTRTIRWGENDVQNTGIDLTISGVTSKVYTAQFDNLDYTEVEPLPSEALASNGDSGGAVFSYVNNQWVLQGITDAMGTFNNQPSSTAVYGDLSYIIDLSQYRDQILTATQTSLAGHKLFYNGSTGYDSSGISQNALPFNADNSIATDKTPYLAGSGAATFANVSSYSRGINGVMVDIAGPHGVITADDFIFRVGNSNAPDSWVNAPAPATVTVRTGAGAGGSDRVQIVWTDNAIQKQWLEVIVRGNDALGGNNFDTGLPDSSVAFWGNAPGDTGAGDTATAALVNATDELGARNNQLLLGASVTNAYDFDRSGAVNATDQLIPRNNGTITANALRFLNISGGGPFAPQSEPEASPASLASSRGRSADAIAVALAIRAGGKAPIAAAPSLSWLASEPRGPLAAYDGRSVVSTVAAQTLQQRISVPASHDDLSDILNEATLVDAQLLDLLSTASELRRGI